MPKKKEEEESEMSLGERVLSVNGQFEVIKCEKMKAHSFDMTRQLGGRSSSRHDNNADFPLRT